MARGFCCNSLQEDTAIPRCLLDINQSRKGRRFVGKNPRIRFGHIGWDAKMVMECIESSSFDLSLNGVLFHDIFTIASDFSRFKTQFVPR